MICEELSPSVCMAICCPCVDRHPRPHGVYRSTGSFRVSPHDPEKAYQPGAAAPHGTVLPMHPEAPDRFGGCLHGCRLDGPLVLSASLTLHTNPNHNQDCPVFPDLSLPKL